jgi:hypothetical protein
MLIGEVEVLVEWWSAMVEESSRTVEQQNRRG